MKKKWGSTILVGARWIRATPCLLRRSDINLGMLSESEQSYFLRFEQLDINSLRFPAVPGLRNGMRPFHPGHEAWTPTLFRVSCLDRTTIADSPDQ